MKKLRRAPCWSLLPAALVSVSPLAALAAALVASACGGSVIATSPGGGGAGGAGQGGAGQGGAVDHDACDGPGQCVLVEPSCCASCESVGIDGVVSIHQDALTDFHLAQCGGVDVGCPACASTYDPRMFAFCEAGTCQKALVQETPLAQCSGPDDCRLRAGLGCCVCNAGGEWVAITAVEEAALEALVCAPGTACAECEPVPPADLFADCIEGVCQVVGN
jgi:hypothetical protein